MRPGRRLLPTAKEIRVKRMHVHVGVKDLDQSIRFYSTLFGQEPARHETDYAKWMLEDPRVNFAISTWGKEPGAPGCTLTVTSSLPTSSPSVAARRRT